MDTAPYVARGPRAAECVADGLWLLRGRPRDTLNVYVMGDVLLDAGTRHSTRRILRSVTDLPLASHVLTHGHMDHMGASHAICEQLGLPLLCGEGDVAAVQSGGREGLAQRPAAMRLAHRLVAGPGHPVAATLVDGEQIGGFTVLQTPGHSPGHLAFWRERDGILIAGDVLFNLDPVTVRAGLRLPPLTLTRDPALNLASARRLAALGPQVVCFGHGPPLRDPDRFQRFVAGASVDAS